VKILTLTQPWASLVALGAKHIETRSWSTSYRGPIAIHAGAGLGPFGTKPVEQRAAFFKLCYSEPFVTVLAPLIRRMRMVAGLALPHYDADLLPRGKIIAVADLVDCCPTFPSLVRGVYVRNGQSFVVDPQEYAFGDYGPGRFAWLLANARPLRSPLPYRGAQGLRPVTPEVAALIGAQL
jgi:activating signal cointegrator 1